MCEVINRCQQKNIHYLYTECYQVNIFGFPCPFPFKSIIDPNKLPRNVTKIQVLSRLKHQIRHKMELMGHKDTE